MAVFFFIATSISFLIFLIFSIVCFFKDKPSKGLGWLMLCWISFQAATLTGIFLYVDTVIEAVSQIKAPGR